MLRALFALTLAVRTFAAPLCPAGTSTRRAGGEIKCDRCQPPGAVSAADAEGWTICVGGTPDKAWCPAGTGTVVINRPSIKSWFCLPCGEGTRSVAYSRDRLVWRECVPLRCAEGEVPVRRPGPVRAYDCVKPQKGQSFDTASLLGPALWEGFIPRCGSGSGLLFDDKSRLFNCERCGDGEDVLIRLGRPVCGLSKPNRQVRWSSLCGDRRVELRGGRCVSCPRGSRLTLEFGQPQCLPAAP